MPYSYGVYPGKMGPDFGPAGWQFARDIKGSEGGPYAAAASDQAASDYYAAPNNLPSFADLITGAGGDVFRQARLGMGLANANTAGVQATNRNRNTGIQGSQNNINDFANARYGQYATQMGQQFANNQRTDQNISIFGQLAKPFFGSGGMLTGGPGSPGAIPQIIGGSSGMPSMNIFSKLLGPGGLMGLFSGGGGLPAAGTAASGVSTALDAGTGPVASTTATAAADAGAGSGIFAGLGSSISSFLPWLTSLFSTAAPLAAAA